MSMTLFRDEYYPMIIGWLQSRRLPLLKLKDLPGLGMIEPNVACGFLVTCDNKTAYLDFYISNPMASKADREKAIDGITVSLEEAAKSLHMTALMCTTQVLAITKYALKHEFKPIGRYSVFSKELQ